MTTTALSLKIQSQLPAALSHVLATPSCSELEQLWWRFKAEEKQIKETFDIFCSGRHGSALSYLMKSGNPNYENAVNASLYKADVGIAIKLLSADYWNLAIKTTDIQEHMPANRKAQWYEQISSLSFPDFTLEALYSTLSSLLNERDIYFAERVEGFYRALSGDHATNSINPTGFYNRFIVANCHQDGSVCSGRADQISDLRYVIGKFVKRDGVPSWCSSNELIKIMLRKPGVWHEIDNGALLIKTHKCGTCHIQVHPDLAWRMNEILAILYPKALAADSRRPNPKVIKEYNLTKNLIPFDVLDVLSQIRPAYERIKNRPDTRGPRIQNAFNISAYDKHLYAKCKALLELIGGVELGYCTFQFDYMPDDVIRSMISTGVVPDHLSHQYYPTPDALAEKMVSMLGALPGSKLLEPSAGLGSIATKLKGDVTCIEVDQLFSKALSAKGLNVITADFLKWSSELENQSCFSGIVMNPPFSQGRAFAHISAAMPLLEPIGVLVALAPRACALKLKCENPTIELHHIDATEFPGVSIDLSIIRYQQSL